MSPGTSAIKKVCNEDSTPHYKREIGYFTGLDRKDKRAIARAIVLLFAAGIISFSACLNPRLFAVVEPFSSNYSQNTRNHWIA